MNLSAELLLDQEIQESMKTETRKISLHNLHIPILFIILVFLIGLGIFLSFLPVGDPRLSRWTDISIIIISISIMIPGIALLFFLFVVIGFFIQVNQHLPPFFSNVNEKVIKTTSLINTFVCASPKPFILLDSLFKGIQSLIKK